MSAIVARPRAPVLGLVTLLLLAALLGRLFVHLKLPLAGTALRLRVIVGLAVALTGALGPFVPGALAWLRALPPRTLATGAAGLVVTTLVLLQEPDPYWLAIAALGAAAPLLALRAERDPGRLGGVGLTVWLLWWIPLDLRWYDRTAPWVTGVGYDATALLVTALGLLAFGVMSRQGREPLDVRLPRLSDVRFGLVTLVAFGLLAIPLGLGLGFLRLASTPRLGPGDAGLALLGNVLTVALPEELYFRGVLDTGLRGHLRRPWASLALSSLAFGLMHWNNGQSAAYVLLASLAGIFYGLAYRAGGLWAAITCHSLVDVLWSVFLKGDKA